MNGASRHSRQGTTCDHFRERCHHAGELSSAEAPRNLRCRRGAFGLQLVGVSSSAKISLDLNVQVGRLAHHRLQLSRASCEAVESASAVVRAAFPCHAPSWLYDDQFTVQSETTVLARAWQQDGYLVDFSYSLSWL